MLPGAVAVAKTLERCGYRRVWYAEHHGSASLVDFPPAVVVAHVAAMTSTIRVGSGGVLAANHSPLSLAEQFGALATFHPGRIDLGVGRGPGTFDPAVMRALRRGADPAADADYRDDVTAILRNVLERSLVPEPWLLASSQAGAALAAELGLPMTFAHHIRPLNTEESVRRYRSEFKPSQWCDAPRVTICVQTICAETDAAAAALARPVEITRAQLETQGADHPLLDVSGAAAYVFSPAEATVVAASRQQQVQGSPEAVRSRLAELATAFEADELMLFTPVSGWKDRARSFELIQQP